MLCDIILYYITFYSILLYYIVLYSMILYYIILYDIILYYIKLYYITLYYILFYDTILYYITLDHITSQHIHTRHHCQHTAFKRLCLTEFHPSYGLTPETLNSSHLPKEHTVYLVLDLNSCFSVSDPFQLWS